MTAPKTVASKLDSNAVIVESTALFGTSYWRADGWEDIEASAQTGDRIEGDFPAGKICGTIRVRNGVFERKPIRAVYVRKDGANYEWPLEYFATLARTVTRLLNDQVEARRK